MTATTPEKRTFGMHPNLLFDVILRQAGTLPKALLEGVMNAIDAGASRVDIALDTHSFSITDDGRGIQTREEVEAFFETFGTPHAEGDAIYGRFRMGRGQMMAFGRNIWRSRQFEMDVDIKTTGLDYTLTEHAEVLAGTRITAELYEPIAPSELERIKGELRKFVAWAQIPVFLNGTEISARPETAKWSYEDDDAWYSLSPERSQIAVYNLGVLVNHFHAGRFGIGGTIVTKRQIEVNFARNDVQSSCPVFRRIQARIRKETGASAKKKTKLTAAERDMLVANFLAGEMSIEDAAGLRGLTDVHGRAWPITKLIKVPHQFAGRLVVAERGDLLCETAQNRGLAFTIDNATLERFGVSDGQAFAQRVADAAGALADTGRDFSKPRMDLVRLAEALDTKITIAERDDLRAFVSDDLIPLAASELGPDETILLTSLTAGLQTLIGALNTAGYEDLSFAPRQIHLGRSETALAWTDGTANIWVDKDHARLLRRGYGGAYQLAQTLLHEMLHTGPDTGTHEHDHAFYQAFHDLCGHPFDPVGQTADRMVSMFTMRLRQKGKKISRKLLARDDLDLQIETARQAAT